ncbi:alpha/beta hydrolase family protein [Lysobacter arvi]|uniref:S9 family peptidase n=1 Tax=Lysobacter arvi TaxID=3038776 RepID=A0ABU1CDZ0_9GAMM|nr:S9 family peptidase [Lysobacter arvi]MDR0182972.1 S9 family peptidase [Lysobacter arvi]
MKPFAVDDLYLHSTLQTVRGAREHAVATFVRSLPSRKRDGYRACAWSVDVSGSGEPRRLTSDESNARSPQLSPDGKTLAFLTRRLGKLGTQIYLLPMAGGEAKRLTSLEHPLESLLGWSADGAWLLASATVPWAECEQDDSSLPAGDRPLVVQHLPYKMDGSGPSVGKRTHLFRIDAASGEATQITHGDFDVEEARWSPDGRHLAYVRTREEKQRHRMDLWIADADGQHAHVATETIAAVSGVQWSPDSTRLVFGGNRTPGDSLDGPWLMALDGGKPTRLGDADLHLEGAQFVWHADNTRIATIVSIRGMQDICVIDSESSRVRHFPRQLRHVLQLGESMDRLVFVAATLRQPEELFSCDWDGQAQRRHTDFNRTWSRKRARPRVTVRGFDVPDGKGGRERIDAWLLRPRGAGPFPVLVDMHGGPQSTVLVDMPSHVYWYELVSRGWMVVAPNAVGSAGYGTEFARRLIGRWGELDLPQYLAILDTLRSDGWIDERVACTGKSYGGFLSAWAVGRCDAFRASVVCAPVSDVESHTGTSDSGYYVTPYAMGGEIDEARERYQRLSPIEYCTHVNAAVLMLQGQDDQRCPLGQSEQLFASMVRFSKKPLRMVVYPGGSHSLASSGRPSHRADYHRRIVDWVVEHVVEPTRRIEPGASDEKAPADAAAS